MEHTSNQSATVDFANELVTPFFTRAQIYAFSLPPSDSVIAKVNKGGQQDYIPHEYIRALLDRYIGPGRWEMRAELHSTDKEIVKKVDYKTKKESENVAATANVNVSLVIHAQDGTDRTLEFSAVGSNTQYAGLDKGYGAIIGNAISSAESLGLKRAATNLGRAFGFDLKSKVKKDDLPPTIAQLAAQLNERHANAQRRVANDQNAAPAIAAPAAPAPAHAPAPAPAATESPPAPVRPDATAPAAETATPAPQAEQIRENQVDQRSETAPQQQRTANGKAGEASAPAEPVAQQEPSTTAAERPAGTPNLTAVEGGAPAGKPNDADWELSMVPTKYKEWLKCIGTISRRMNAMQSEREIENFIRRNKKLLDKLPVIPATDNQPEKSFKKRWVNIVNKRCDELNITVPAEYALPKAA